MSNIPWSYRLYRLAWSGPDLLFPPRCGGCGRVGLHWHSDYQISVPYVNEPLCEKGGIPTGSTKLSEKCESNPPTYQITRFWAIFDSPILNALHNLKYRRNKGIGDTAASPMANFIRGLNWNMDILVPLPLRQKRLGERGYNQIGLVW